MRPAPLSGFLMNILKIPFSLFIRQNPRQIILRAIPGLLRMQFCQDMNILLKLFYRNAQQLVYIRTDIVCLICLCIQHEKDIIHIHRELFEKFIPIQDFCILFLQTYTALFEDKSNDKQRNAKHHCPHKEHSTKLQGIHTGIDDIRRDQPQQCPVLDF